MAGVSVGFAKCFILFMAVVIFAQGAVYLGLAIWGITLHECSTEPTEIAKEPFKFAMDLIYFSDKSCGDPIVSLEGQSATLSMDWEKSDKITHREFIFFVTYAVISGLWLVTSLLIITTLCNATTKVISGVIYWPWFLSVIAGSIVDVVATVYHGLDLSHTLTYQEAFEYIGATLSTPELGTFLEPFGVYFSTPAILMICLSCRVVLIWLLNVFGSAFCLSLSTILAKQTAEKSAANKTAPTSSQAPTRQPTPQPQPQPQPLTPQPQPVVQAVVVPEPVLLEYPEQIRPKPLPIIIPAEQFPRQDRTTLQSPVMVLPPPQQQQADINTYRHTEAHPDRLNYPPSEPPTPRAPSPAVQQLAVTSPLNNRYSEIYPTAPPANPRVSEELRNQMPWSYTSMTAKPPPPPRKPQLQVQIYPQIPEPDYAEH
ncbi:uncharacterized protein Dwil_GK12662 [Drosophila willistoni]|uniref:Uncharacterized protein n=1 Tax=Drosophila willistoni TaxID=7260 RepID=B4N397_DROWI|nr:uncharacterized protein LOC6645101 [Drosophila willistoni]EDW78836.1 uncharacterized protein Dwil_GK12662 [Drosophila willistoni]